MTDLDEAVKRLEGAREGGIFYPSDITLVLDTLAEAQEDARKSRDAGKRILADALRGWQERDEALAVIEQAKAALQDRDGDRAYGRRSERILADRRGKPVLMTIEEEIARVTHEWRDHAVDGTPLGAEPICNCYQYARAIAPLLNRVRAEARASVVTDRARAHWNWAQARRERFNDEGCACELCEVMARIEQNSEGNET